MDSSPCKDGVSAAAPSRATADMTAPIVFVGISRLIRTVGSQTTVPARSSACMRTSGVSFRKSAAVLGGPRLDGGPSGMLYAHLVIVTTQSVTCQPKRPSRSASRTYSPMCSVKLSNVL